MVREEVLAAVVVVLLRAGVGERRRRGRGRSDGLVVALQVAECVLEWVEGDLAGLARRSLLTAIAIAEDVEVVRVLHGKQIQAALHPQVLAHHRPIQLVLAALLTRDVSLKSDAREDLHGTEQAEGDLAVHQVHVRGARGRGETREVRDEALREEDGVRIDLDCPVMQPEATIFAHLVPSLHEDLGVQDALKGARLRGCCEVPAQDHGLHRRDAVHELQVAKAGDRHARLDGVRLIAEENEVVARKDGGLLGECCTHIVQLVAVDAHDRVAKHSGRVVVRGAERGGRRFGRRRSDREGSGRDGRGGQRGG
mmetsp:Transcript_154630/g.495770  ORF Transcript_154630/g.495770 Transcript_154630/m.495770 type:complete len:310 (-) Transcript_154630:903-1832(-)